MFSAGTHTLATGNLPLLRKIVNLPFGGQTPFAAEVYFINKSVSLAKDWGSKTPVMLLDPRYRVTIPLRGYGTYAIRVVNSREFVVQVVGASAGALADVTASHLLDSPIVTCIQQGFGDYLSEAEDMRLGFASTCTRTRETRCRFARRELQNVRGRTAQLRCREHQL